MEREKGFYNRITEILVLLIQESICGIYENETDCHKQFDKLSAQVDSNIIIEIVSIPKNKYVLAMLKKAKSIRKESDKLFNNYYNETI